jgi:hypothetical protein
MLNYTIQNYANIAGVDKNAFLEGVIAMLKKFWQGGKRAKRQERRKNSFDLISSFFSWLIFPPFLFYSLSQHFSPFPL